MHPTGSIRHVVITGGEPMLFAEMLPLCERLTSGGLHITIETAGTLFLPVRCDLMSISPKLASSTPSVETAGKWSVRHEQTRHQQEVIRRLTSESEYQLKFVIDTRADVEDVQDWLAEFTQILRERVLLMPQGIDQEALARIGEWLEPYCRQQGFVFCPRRHIEWYGAVRGT
jgi:7-carboxy-7-deazaguanine synthase